MALSESVDTHQFLTGITPVRRVTSYWQSMLCRWIAKATRVLPYNQSESLCQYNSLCRQCYTIGFQERINNDTI